MIFSSGFMMFVLFGVVIAFGKLLSGDKSMGCLIPLLIGILILGLMGFIISAVTMI